MNNLNDTQVTDAITNGAIVDPRIQVQPVYRAQTNAFGPLDYPFLIDIARQTNATRILDIGTGEGTFLLGLAQRVQGAAFDAIDLNRRLVETAKSNCEKLGLHINFQHATFGDQYVKSDYDLIMARFAVEHIKELSDIDAFVATAYKKLRPNGWLVIIEYFVAELDIDDTVWKKFRESELATYASAGAHPRIGLRLPQSLLKAQYKNVRSTINHISPSTIGADAFYGSCTNTHNFTPRFHLTIGRTNSSPRLIHGAITGDQKVSPSFLRHIQLGKKPQSDLRARWAITRDQYDSEA